jgi:hypothetical protein
MPGIFDLAPGGEDNQLALELLEAIRGNVQDNWSTHRVFHLMRGSIAVTAVDIGLSATLRFDHGRLTVHDGVVGIPDVTLRGERQAIFCFSSFAFRRYLGVPFLNLSAGKGWKALRELRQAVGEGKLTIYGLWLHLPLLVRLARVMSHS